MSRGWRALEEEHIDGWVARYSGGVTKRANSVLPLGVPEDRERAIADIELRYAQRGLPTVFQISPDSLPLGLDRLLAERGYLPDSPTLVQYLDLCAGATDTAGGTDPRIKLSVEPSEKWLETLCAVEGPHMPVHQALIRDILARTPSIYASLIAETGVEAVGRLALVGNLGGIYAVATREGSRSRGYGRAVVRALLAEASARDLGGVWLQVLTSNEAARGLYASLGFKTVSRYHYRQLDA